MSGGRRPAEAAGGAWPREAAWEEKAALESSLEEMRGRLLDAERLAAEHDAEKKQLLGRLEEEMKKDEVVHRFEREIGEKDAEISRIYKTQKMRAFR
ncbi:hypothetical protein ZWY2020_012021 [Hordeum vulgare]|nr:hypothetical protein ZWY2020_012021 [Hordeum vulgare]